MCIGAKRDRANRDAFQGPQKEEIFRNQLILFCHACLVSFYPAGEKEKIVWADPDRIAERRRKPSSLAGKYLFKP